MVDDQLGNNKGQKKSAQRTPFTTEQVLAEIEKQKSRKKHWINNLVILLVTLLIFFRLGLFKSGVTDVLIIILVILIHEAGHFVGMRLFGYKNVQMFFIPFFGAAVSGQSRNVPAYKKAIVTLLGPLPGIFFGIVFAVAYLLTKTALYKQMMIMFLILNAFNLLPFFPLDGGRFLHEVLFSRNRYIELVFSVFAALALIGLGLLMGAWLLAAFGLFALIGAQFPFRVAAIANQLKPQFAAAESPYMDTPPPEPEQTESIPPEIAEQIIDKIRQKFTGRLTVKAVAGYTKQVWERMHVRPPRVPATLLLLGVYLFCFCFSFVAVMGAAAVSMFEKGPYETKIVEYKKPDGQTGREEQTYLFGGLTSKTELAPDKPLYHGSTVSYFLDGTVIEEGQWYEGRKDGQWKFYDPNGDLLSVMVWNKGQFILRKERQNGRWVEKTFEELDPIFQEEIRLTMESPPCGPLPDDPNQKATETEQIALPAQPLAQIAGKYITYRTPHALWAPLTSYPTDMYSWTILPSSPPPGKPLPRTQTGIPPVIFPTPRTTLLTNATSTFLSAITS
jgi:Zn-dependent protease